MANGDPAARPAKPKVVELAAARKPPPGGPAPRQRAWLPWAGMAACLVVGVIAGRANLPGDDVSTRGGQLVARGALAQALSTQLASAQAVDAPVKISVSYLSRAGEYCRSFVQRPGLGGLACRRGDEWELRVLAQDPASAGGALRLIDAQIQDGVLNAPAEREAMNKGWRK